MRKYSGSPGLEDGSLSGWGRYDNGLKDNKREVGILCSWEEEWCGQET